MLACKHIQSGHDIICSAGLRICTASKSIKLIGFADIQAAYREAAVVFIRLYIEIIFSSRRNCKIIQQISLRLQQAAASTLSVRRETRIQCQRIFCLSVGRIDQSFIRSPGTGIIAGIIGDIVPIVSVHVRACRYIAAILHIIRAEIKIESLNQHRCDRLRNNNLLIVVYFGGHFIVLARGYRQGSEQGSCQTYILSHRFHFNRINYKLLYSSIFKAFKAI